MPKKVLVIGGTGMLGRPVARRLKHDGFVVTVMSSHPEIAREKLGDSLAIVEGDITDKDSLKRAIDGQSMVHINLSAHLKPELYETIEIQGTANIAEVAKELGVKRISCISSATSHGVIEGPIYLEGKVRAEQALISSGVAYTIMRPSWFFESLPIFIQSGRAGIIGEQPNKLRWLAADDYAGQVSKALLSSEAANKCFYSLGPEALSMMEALEQYCQRLHPDLEPQTVSFEMARTLALMPGMESMKTFIPFFEYFNDYREEADSAEADSLLGANKTTLSKWLESQKSH